jgi:hypothetical protein
VPTIDLLWLVIICIIILIAVIGLNIYNVRHYGFFGRFKEHRKPITITILWSLAVALVTIKAYWIVYLANPQLFTGVVWTHVPDWIPHVDGWDMLVIFVISLIAGALLLEVETIIYGLITTFILSFIFTLIWATFFMWYSLGAASLQSLLGLTFTDALSLVLYVGSRIVFGMTFPYVHFLLAAGALVGAFGRVWLQPSSEFGKS